MKFMFFTALVGALAYFLSTRVKAGTCPNVKTFQNFEPQKYMGKWYEITKYPVIFETGLKCVTATYGLNANGTVTVQNAGILKGLNLPVSITGLATPLPSDNSKLKVKFNYFAEGDYWLIDTDYTSYALVYACRDLPVPGFELKFEYAWILSRKPTLDEKRIASLTKMLSKYSTNTNDLQRTDQKDCPKN